MQNLIGTSIDHYQILVKIRETPTRVLYRAYNTKAQNYTALEVLKTSGPEPSELLRLINDQMSKTAELVHPNIANITDTGLSEGLIYIVYNFSPTQPFRRFFNRTFSWREMTREFVSITHALAYAHEKGIVHGALHPSSIVLDEKRNPVLFDFGFEQIITNYLLAHAPGTWLNRWGFEYRAPEQLDGARPDERSDIYALGIMLHEWLIGKIAFLDSTILGTLRIRKVPRAIFDKNSPVPPAVQNLIEKCIAANPAERYQSMQEIYILLARGALDMSVTRRMVRKPLDIPARPFNWRRLLIGVGVLAMLGAFVVLFMSVSALSAREHPASASPTPSRIQVTPTHTAVKPASIPTQEVAASETPGPASPAFPVFQGTPISSAVDQKLQTGNTNKMVMLSLWGIGDVNRLAASPNGKQVAVASSIGIFVFDAQSLELERYLDTRSWITALDFSPDSQTLATGDQDGLIQLWNTATWQEVGAPLSGHLKAILDLAFAPDGTKLASASLDNLLIQWGLTGGQELARTQVIGGLSAVAYSDDNTRLITGGNDFQIKIWDANTLTVLKTTAFSAKIVDIAKVKGSDVFILGGTDQQVVILDITGEPVLTQVGSLQYPLTAVAVSPNGKLVAAGDINGGMTVWDISGKKFAELWKTKNYVLADVSDLTGPGSPHSLAFSPDGALIFSGLHNGIIRSVDANTGADVKQNQSLSAHVQKLAISHASQYLITQQEDDLITAWNLQTGKDLYQLQGEFKDGNPFSQDDRMLAVASDPETVKVYNPADGKEIYTFNSARNPEAIQFIKASAQLVTVFHQSMDLWSMSSGEGLKTTRHYEGTGCATIYDVNGDPVVYITNYYHVIANDQNRLGLCSFDVLDWAIAINEDQGLIAYGGSSKLSVLNIQNAGSKAQDMHGVNRKNIVRVALSPDGGLLAAAYDDNTIHIWDVATQEEVSSLYGHTDSITDLQFTPDGKMLISSSSDGTLRLWGVPD